MTEFLTACVVLLCMLASAWVGLLVRPLLPEAHRSRETMAVVGLVISLLVTFSSLVLGLLTYSVKGSFDRADDDLRGYSIALIQLDRTLREYGTGADAARALLHGYTAAAIADTWPDEAPPPGDYYPKHLQAANSRLENRVLGEMLDRVEIEIRRLVPQNAFQTRLAADCLRRFENLAHQRWKLIEEAHDSISLPFFLVLIFWLLVVFASFGLSAPRNALVYVIVGLCAISIASAVYVILDMDTPFSGFIVVSSQPMRDALEHLSR